MGDAPSGTPAPSSPVNLLIIIPVVIIIAAAIIAIKCTFWWPHIHSKIASWSKGAVFRRRKRKGSDPSEPAEADIIGGTGNVKADEP